MRLWQDVYGSCPRDILQNLILKRASSIGRGRPLRGNLNEKDPVHTLQIAPNSCTVFPPTECLFVPFFMLIFVYIPYFRQRATETRMKPLKPEARV